MRAGTSLLTEEDIWSTNPMLLTNRDDALSLAGEEEVRKAADQLKEASVAPTLVMHSLAASSSDSAKILGQELRMGMSSIMPEYTFMDPRALGAWDMLTYSETQPAIWAMDNDEAGPNGLQGRPPANDDGTPHETLSDQAVRLAQLFSNMETLHSGDTILLVFPDGTGPALLSAMIAGIPLNRCHELEFIPGELRTHVDRDAITTHWNEKKTSQEHKALLADGRNQLSKLRASKSIINRQDLKLDEERLAIDNNLKTQQLKEKNSDVDRKVAIQRRKEALGDDLDETQSKASLAALSVPVVGTSVFYGLKPNEEKEQLPTAAAYASAINETTSSHSHTDYTEKEDSSTLSPDSNTHSSLEDKERIAREAMQSYIDSDDGHVGWLQSISEILKEDDFTVKQENVS